MLPETTGAQKPTIDEKSGELRFEAYVSGLNTELNLLSMKCGLGESYYRMDGQAVMTATQVVSENSTLFRSLKKHEILLENVLRNLTKVIVHASNEFTSNPIGEIEDNDETLENDRTYRQILRDLTTVRQQVLDYKKTVFPIKGFDILDATKINVYSLLKRAEIIEIMGFLPSVAYRNNTDKKIERDSESRRSGIA